jgi:voltage-gated potassium channel Kch
MKLRSVGLCLLAGSVFSAASITSCGGADPKTFVLVTITQGNITDPAAVKSIDLTLTLDTGGLSDTVTVLLPDGLMQPATKSLELVSGSGLLEVKAVARNASLGAISNGTSYVTVLRDKTNNAVNVQFGVVEPKPMPDGGTTTDLAVFAPSVTARHEFGTVVLGKTSGTAVFSVKNIGTATSGLITVSMAGANPTAFSISLNECRTLDPGLAKDASCNVGVTANPGGTAGDFLGDLTIRAASGASTIIPVKVNGVATSMLSVTPDGIMDFANTGAGGTSAPITFTFTNGGAAATSALAVSITGADGASFVKGTDMCSGNSVAAAGTCTVDVTFHPTVPAHKVSAQLTFTAGAVVTAAAMTGTAN